jgi:gliding motility-associated-like protein
MYKKGMKSLNFLISCLILLFAPAVRAQVTVAFQGGEPGDTWTYTSTSASATAESESYLAPNKVSGTKSLVVGGNTGGGSCFAGGSGNGPDVARTFTFNPVDITSSNQSARTLNFHWGNRFPSCNGTGYDSGENLVFRAYHDGVAQPPVTIVSGSGNAAYSIQTHFHNHTIPPCVNSFSFTLSVTTNRADELLFIDDVKITAPQLNTVTPVTITGNTTVCPSATETYSVPNTAGNTYLWSVSPAGPQFSTANGSSSIGVNWLGAAQGAYTLTVQVTGPCGGAPVTGTLTVNVSAATPPVTISGPTTICPGGTATLTSDASSGNTWSTTETTQSVTVSAPGTYSVSVNGACGAVTDQHVITLDNGPDITGVTVTNSSCYGSNDGWVSVSASGTPLEYSLDNSSWQPSSVFTGLPVGPVTIYVHEIGGCTSDTTVTIGEPAQITASASNNGPVCAGTPATLTGSSSTPGVSYSWSGPGGYSSAVQSPNDATLAGTYTLTVSLGTCSSAPAQTTLVVMPLPVANATTGGPYCQGNAIALHGTSSVSGASYSWTGPNGFVSSAQDPANAQSAGQYSLTVSAGGCTSVPVNVTVVVNPAPDAQASYNAPYCPGTQLLLNGSTSAAGTVTYQWSGPSGYSSQQEDPTDATAAGTYLFVVTSNGCSSQPALVNVVQESPVVTVSNTGPYCAGTPVQLLSTVATPGTPSFSWTGPAGYSSQLEDPAGATQSGIYTLTVTMNGCPVSASTVVTVYDAPVAEFSANDTCAGLPVALASSSYAVGPQNIESWAWELGDGNTASGENAQYIYDGGGNFDVTLTVTTNRGCQASITKNVTVFNRPKASFMTSSETVSDLDPTVRLINTSTGANSYEWWIASADDTFYEESPEYTFESVGEDQLIRLVAFNEVGCSDTFTRILASEVTALYYVPNAFTPDGDELNQTFQPVFTQGFDPGNFTMLIFDRWGEVIFESHDAGMGWDGMLADALAPMGTYVWQIKWHRPGSADSEELQGHVSLIR